MARKTTPKGPQPRSRGQLIARGKDTWLVRVPRGTEVGTGKRQYHNETVKGTRRDAEKALVRVLRDLDKGEYIAPAKDTVEAFAEVWLSTKKDVIAKTLHGYKMRLEGDILPLIGKMKLDKVTPMECQRVIDAASGAGLSPRTVHLSYGVLSQLMEQAVTWGLISKNPVLKVTLPRIKRREPSVLSPEAVGKIFKGTESTRYGALWVCMLTTGMRPSEVAALRWSDYDGQRVMISRSLTEQMVDGHSRGWLPEDTKTDASRRTIELFAVAVEALEAHRKWLAKDMFKRGYRNPLDLIFPSSKGSYAHLDALRVVWLRTLTQLEIPRVRMYDQRHTHATHLLVAGEHPKIVQERMGHANVGITLDIYSHVLPGMHKEAVTRAEGKLNYGG
jgi:integrase